MSGYGLLPDGQSSKPHRADEARTNARLPGFRLHPLSSGASATGRIRRDKSAESLKAKCQMLKPAEF
jgi:hypothetical protein